MSSVWVDLLGSQTVYRGKKYRPRVIEAGEGEPLILIHGIGGHAEEPEEHDRVVAAFPQGTAVN